MVTIEDANADLCGFIMLSFGRGLSSFFPIVTAGAVLDLVSAGVPCFTGPGSSISMVLLPPVNNCALGPEVFRNHTFKGLFIIQVDNLQILTVQFEFLMYSYIFQVLYIYVCK